MPDPIWKVIQRYTEEITQLGWTLSYFMQAAAHPAPGDINFEAFNTAYLNLCADTVHLMDIRMSSVGAYRDEFIIPGADMITTDGQAEGAATEIASYAQLRGQGGRILQGSSAWKLHGIADDFVAGSNLIVSDAAVVAMSAAALAWLKLYRPDATDNLPSVTTPAAFVSFQTTGMYNRRLGRPFSSPGQQRRYTRTVPTPP